MKISESTIADIIKHGDATTMYEIIRTLIRTLNERDERLRRQEESSTNLGTAFVKAESERDRFRRMAAELLELCREAGHTGKAEGIVRLHGGFDEPDESSKEEITVELD